jgi:hypothetical protein
MLSRSNCLYRRLTGGSTGLSRGRAKRRVATDSGFAYDHVTQYHLQRQR